MSDHIQTLREMFAVCANERRMQEADALNAAIIAISTLPEDAGCAPRLIGWRTADYLYETSDPAQARNWEGNVQVLPIFAGDPNTKLPAAPATGQEGKE